MTTTETAAALGISRGRVAQLVSQGRIKGTYDPDTRTWDLDPSTYTPMPVGKPKGSKNKMKIPPAVITFDSLGVYGVTVGDVEYARCQKCNRLAESVTRGDSGYCADCTHGFDIVDEPKFESLDDLIKYHVEALKA